MEATLGRVRVPIAVATATFLVISLFLMFAAPARATHVAPELQTGTGNQTCTDFEGEGQTWIELKVDPPAAGVHSDGTLSVTISNLTDTSFDWSSNIGVDAVFVKSGSGGSNLYRYDPPTEATSDTGLQTPGGVQDISHISFCYDTPDPSTTTSTEGTTTTVEGTTTSTEGTTTSTEGTTTTTEGTTTTTESRTTTTEGTTTTTEGTTTTTVGDTVLGTTITTTSTTVGDTVLGTTLPFTGAESQSLALLAMALSAAGGLVLLATRRVTE